MTESLWEDSFLKELLKHSGPTIVEVPIDPEQTYFPKIMSSVQSDGSMKSNPLHLMSPPLQSDMANWAFKYLPEMRKGK